MIKMINRFFLLFLLLSAGSISAQTITEGIKAFESEKFELSARLFEQITMANPSEPKSYFFQGWSYLKNGNVSKARAAFDAGVKVLPINPLNHAGLGMVAAEEDNKEQATKHFTTAIQLAERFKEAETVRLVGEALLWADYNDHANAMKMVERAVTLDKKHAEIYFTTGNIFFEMYNGGKAISNYEKAIELNPKHTGAYWKIGAVYALARNYEESLKPLTKALEIDPSFGPAYRELAELYYQSRQYDKAIEQYKKYIDITASQNPEVRARYASFLYLNKNYAEARKELDEVLKKDTTNMYVWRVLAYSSYETEQYQEGLAASTKFFSIANPKKILASDYEYLGKLYSKTGQDSMAILNYNKAIEKDTSLVDLHYSLIEIHNKNKDYELSHKEYEKIMQKKSKLSVNDLFNIGRSYYLVKNYKTADSLFAVVVEMQPAFPIATLYRARSNTFLEKGENTLAKPFYEEFITKASAEQAKYKRELTEAYDYLGRYYYNKSDIANAKKNFEKVVELDPTHKTAKEALKNINAAQRK